MAKEQNFTEADNFFKGEKKQLVFNVIDSVDNPQTMTGWELAFSMYRQGTTGTSILSKTTMSGIVIGNGDSTDDRATVTCDAADTSGLPAGTYLYELARTDSGNEAVLAYGTLALRTTKA